MRKAFAVSLLQICVVVLVWLTARWFYLSERVETLDPNPSESPLLETTTSNAKPHKLVERPTVEKGEEELGETVEVNVEGLTRILGETVFAEGLLTDSFIELMGLTAQQVSEYNAIIERTLSSLAMHEEQNMTVVDEANGDQYVKISPFAEGAELKKDLQEALHNTFEDKSALIWARIKKARNFGNFGRFEQRISIIGEDGFLLENMMYNTKGKLVKGWKQRKSQEERDDIIKRYGHLIHTQ